MASKVRLGGGINPDEGIVSGDLILLLFVNVMLFILVAYGVHLHENVDDALC